MRAARAAPPRGRRNKVRRRSVIRIKIVKLKVSMRLTTRDVFQVRTLANLKTYPSIYMSSEARPSDARAHRISAAHACKLCVSND